MADKNPREVRLSDGRVVIINLNVLTWAEFREMSRGAPTTKDDKDGEVSERAYRYAGMFGRTCGLTADEVIGLGVEDYLRIQKRQNQLVLNPLDADPN